MKNPGVDYFKFSYNKVEPKQGLVLISEPFLNDLYFQRSVVLLTEHSAEQGTIGFVLNKPVETKLNEVLTDFENIRGTISVGGPVSTNTIHYLHTYGARVPESVHVLENIYWGGDFSMLKKIISQEGYDQAKVRFFLGYSGWSPGQLDDELAANSWLVASIDPAAIMTPDTQIWKHSLTRMGKKFTVWANSPSNPSLN